MSAHLEIFAGGRAWRVRRCEMSDGFSWWLDSEGVPSLQVCAGHGRPFCMRGRGLLGASTWKH